MKLSFKVTGALRRLYHQAIRVFRIALKIPSFVPLIILQLISGLAGFLGMPLLVPVLEWINQGSLSTHPDDTLLRLLQNTFSFLGIPLTFGYLLFVLSILIIGNFALNAVVVLWGQYLQYDLFANCNIRLLNGYLNVRWPWMVEHHSGEINHALYAESATWSETVFQTLKLITTLIQLVTFFAVALYISWYTTLIAGAFFAVIMGVNLFLSTSIKTISKQKNDQQRSFAELVQEIQQNRKYLKSSLQSKGIVRSYHNIVRGLVSKARGIAWRHQFQIAWTSSAAFLTLVWLIYIHSSLGISFNALMVLIVAFVRMVPLVSAVASHYAMLSSQIPVYDSIEERLSDLDENKEKHGSKPYRRGSDISFKAVVFGYQPERFQLKEINLNIPARSTTALVCESGEGKSTLLDLLLGLWHPQSGTIWYGDVSHKELDYLSLRSNVAYVSQETTLFNGTLRENLSLGKPEASDSELVNVCSLVHLDDFVRSLPHGLDTLVGENGVRLSGGQRQRLALGRALLLDPDLLILDEATSSLDLNSERMIKQTIQRIHGNLTLLIVTHRISAVTDADTIYVIEKGRIRESGSYPELLDLKGRFAYFHSLQSGQQ